MKVFLLALLALVHTCAALEVAVRVEALEIPGEKLRGNPLGDPMARHAAVLAPRGSSPDEKLPMVYYLPGWGGSCEEYIAAGNGSAYARMVAELAAQGMPLRIVVVDGRTRWGGSQFLNTPAMGNYADYVAEEVVRVVEKTFALAPGRRLIAGHSSGGYGALMLAMQRHALFAGVVALSPDSDFERTHKGLVEQPAVRGVKAKEVAAWMPPSTAQPANGLVGLICGLCASYAPTGKPGQFAWLYDDRGQWQPAVWQRWLDADPLTAVRKNRDAFAPAQRVYLDGAEFDEFKANLGARAIYEALRDRASPVTFYESPGHHSDRLAERFARGLAWALSSKPTGQ